VIFMSAHNQLFQPTLLHGRLPSTGTLGKPIPTIETFQSRAFDPIPMSQRVSEVVNWGWRRPQTVRREESC